MEDEAPTPHGEGEVILDAAAITKEAQEEAYRREVVKLIFGNAGLILSDFSCSVESKMTLHGHMYVTTRFICFYSNFFGYEKKILLPYKTINCISKTSDSVFLSPGVEISTAKQGYVFRNFWDREEAYKILRDCHRAGVGQPHLPDSVFPNLVRRIRSSQATRRAAKQAIERHASASSDAAAARPPLTRPTSFTAAQEIGRELASPMTLDERLGGAAEHEVGSPRSSTHGAGTHPRSSSSGDGPLESDADETKDITPAQLQHPDEGDELHGVVDDVVDEEEGPAGEERLNIGEKERFEMATQDRRLAHVLCEGRFEQMTVGDFWEHFLRNDAPFNLPQFQEERGDKEMECHMWGAPHAHAEGAANGAAGADGEGGNGRQSPSETAADSQPAGPPGATGQVRSLHFLTPVKAGPVGPSEAPAIKMQRVRRFGDFGMMVDSSVSLDKSVPMADAFTVEDTMTVEQDGVDIKLCITFEVKFKRPIMLKSIIASKSKTDTGTPIPTLYLIFTPTGYPNPNPDPDPDPDPSSSPNPNPNPGSFYQDWLTAAQHYWDRVLHPDTHKARRKSIKKHKPKPDPEKPEKGFLITWLLALVFGIQEGERGRPPTIPLMPYLLAIVFGYLYMFSSPQAPPMVPGVDLGSGLGFGLGSVPPGGAAVPDVIELLQRLDQRLERLEERLGEQGFPPAQPCNPES